MLKVQQIDHVAITVSDLERSRVWYRDVLGLERRHEEEWGDMPTMMCVPTDARLGAGETCVALFPSDGPHLEEVNVNETVSMRHFAFRVDRANFEQAQQQFGERRLAFESADHGIAHSVYIHDPDGHRTEITAYEV